jgi:DNA primase
VVPVPTARGLIRFEERLAADIRIVTLPAGLDPDEVIRESPGRWAQLIAQAKPVMDYYFDALTGDLDLSTAKGKAEAVRVLGPLIAELGDRVQRSHYLQQLSRMVQVDERTLWQQISRTTGRKRPRRSAKPEAQADGSLQAPLGPDGHCLSFVLFHPGLLHQADEALRACGEEPLRGEDLDRPEDRAILASWRNWLAEGSEPNARATFYDTLDENLQARIDTLIRVQEDQPPATDDLLRIEVLDAVSRLRLRSLRREIRDLRFLLEDVGDGEVATTYGPLVNQAMMRRARLEQSMYERSISGRRQREDATIRIPVGAE